MVSLAAHHPPHDLALVFGHRIPNTLDVVFLVEMEVRLNDSHVLKLIKVDLVL